MGTRSAPPCASLAARRRSHICLRARRTDARVSDRAVSSYFPTARSRAGEEEKVKWETLVILGALERTDFALALAARVRCGAACNRLPVIGRHAECISVRLALRAQPGPQQMSEALLANLRPTRRGPGARARRAERSLYMGNPTARSRALTYTTGTSRTCLSAG